MILPNKWVKDKKTTLKEPILLYIYALSEICQFSLKLEERWADLQV